jgi:isopentenyl diphosphate isomerase/L-lactate dehydrogenase-like FMN-dependent dehydrogenase/rubredoxin
MAVYQCKYCDTYAYDEDEGDSKTDLEPGTEWQEINESWRCPFCQGTKDSLRKLNEADAIKAYEKYQNFLTEISSTMRVSMNLTEVRKNAQNKIRGICSVNKVCDGDPKRMCMGQHYNEPIGFGGVGKGLSFTENIKALDKIKLKTRLISEHKMPDMTTNLYAHEISIPVMASSLSGVKASMGGSISEEDFAYAVLQGSKDAGTLGWIGNTADEGKELAGVESIRKVGLGIPIFKPQQNDKLITLIKLAEDVGASAVGVDLDGVGSTNWERMNKPLFRKSVAELTELSDSTELPFIVKGIMSVHDALDAVDAGVAGIDISNHGGRALESTRGVAEVLPEIVGSIKGKAVITSGGGVRTGFDVLKILALGADGVLLGRDIIRAAIGGGPAGVKLHFEYILKDLQRGMILTSCNSIEEINERIIDKE